MSTFQIPSFSMKARRLAVQIQYFIIAFALTTVFAARGMAQDGHSHKPTLQQQHEAAQQGDPGALISIVRENTARFKNVLVAEAEGYALQFGCVSGPDAGAMGLHYVNAKLVASGVLDATRPQIVIYEASADGSLQLIGADYLLIADTWNAKHSGPPELFGQLFHLFETPNRFGLPAFYTLHVWAWKDNPKGAFVNWHPNVSCESFGGQK